MSIVFKIPPQAVKYLPPANIFTAAFGLPVIGKYSFGLQGSLSNIVAGNVRQAVIPMKQNMQYLIERMHIGGDIDEAQFLASLDVATDPAFLPYVVLEKKLGNDQVTQTKIPVVQFITNREAPVFVSSDKKNDALQVSFYGVLKQIAATVGKPSISVAVSLSIYEIQPREFNQYFRNGTTK